MSLRSELVFGRFRRNIAPSSIPQDAVHAKMRTRCDRPAHRRRTPDQCATEQYRTGGSRSDCRPHPASAAARRLERDGYIDGYRASCGVAASGSASRPFSASRSTATPTSRRWRFEHTVVAMPEVVACHLVSGEVDYLLEIVGARARGLPALPGRQAAQSAHRARGSQQHRDPDAEGGCALPLSHLAAP